MQVKMIALAAGPHGAWPSGSVVEVDESTAAALIGGGFAEQVGSRAPVERAAIAPVEKRSGKRLPTP